MKPAVLVLAAGLLAASPLAAQWVETLEAARQQARIGAYHGAEEDFQRALEQAPNQQARVEITADYADSLARSAEGRATAAHLNTQAAELYEQALQSAAGSLRVRTANNYGALLVRQGKADRAVDVLEKIQSDPTLIQDGSVHARYLYNLARAYELTGKLDDARRSYERSARSDPSLTPPARAVLRILGDSDPATEAVAATGAWIDFLVGRGNLDIALDGLASCFARPAWTARADFSHIMRALISYLTALRATPGTFEADWAPRLRSLPEEPPVSRAIGQELIKLYLDDLPVSFSPRVAQDLFRHSLTQVPEAVDRPSPSVMLSRLLKAVGDVYSEASAPQRALQRYALGSAIDLHGENIDATLYAANVLLWDNENIDHPDRLLNELVDRLFTGKGEAYRSSDWENILRFHTVLGTIFEQRGVWGSEHEARSAIFQFDHALRVYERLAGGRQAPAPVNGVRIRLAKSYEGTKRYDDAARLFLDAADDAIRRKQSEVTGEALKETEQLVAAHAVSAAQRARLEELRAKAEDLTPESPPPAADTVEIDLSEAANQVLGKTSCYSETPKYRRIVSELGAVDAQTRVIETERRQRATPAEIGIAALVDHPRQIQLLLCVTQIPEELLEQAEIGKLRLEFASGPPLLMPIANIGSDPSWIRIKNAGEDGRRSYLRSLVVPLRKPFSSAHLVRVVLVDESRNYDSADPGLTLIKLLVTKKS